MWAQKFLRLVAALCLVVAVAAGVVLFAAWQSAIDPVDPPPPAAFDPSVVKRGAALAAIGDCQVCHTAPGGRECAQCRVACGGPLDR